MPSNDERPSNSEELEGTKGEPAIERCQLKRTEDDEVVHLSVGRGAKVVKGYGD